MAESRKHKECIEDCKNKLTQSHNCRRESLIYRDGWKYLDLECYPHNSSTDKPTAIECECNSGRLQRQSNREDLLEWKRKNPEGVAWQIEDASQLDVDKIKKKPKPQFRSRYRRRFR